MKSIIKIFTKALLQFLSDITNGKLSSFALDQFIPVYRLVHNKKHLFFFTPNHITYWRAKTLLSKEPETISWLDEYVKPGEVLYDIGANVGCYSLYAAIFREARVFSFEPAYMNYYILCKNINFNHATTKITPYMIAFSDKSSLTSIAIPNNVDGAACTTINPCLKNHNDFNHGLVSYTLDDFAYTQGVLFPDHIKIDVDGVESKIIEGGLKTLQDPKLKTVQIEINEKLDDDRKIIPIMNQYGFQIRSRKNGPSYHGKSEYKDVFNYLFVRN